MKNEETFRQPNIACNIRGRKTSVRVDDCISSSARQENTDIQIKKGTIKKNKKNSMDKSIDNVAKMLSLLKIKEDNSNIVNTINLKNSKNANIDTKHFTQPNVTLKIFVQNIRSINEEHKKQYVTDIMNRHDPDILALTETWECESLKFGIEKYFPHHKTIIARATENCYKGQGIAVIIKYPLAQNIMSFKTIRGRVINLIIKKRKKNPISLYFFQAPTAPYGIGYEETLELSLLIRKLFLKDLINGRDIIVSGDINSYPDKLIDYDGDNLGQNPSKLIQLLQEFEMTDIYRLMYQDQQIFTFCNKRVKSRLDHFWLSQRLLKTVIKTSVWDIDNVISDHAMVTLEINWRHKKSKSIQFEKTHWSNKNLEKVEDFSKKAIIFCEKFLEISKIYDDCNFKIKYKKLVEAFKRYAKKIFWKRKRKKRNDKPPIWLYIMRRLRKAARTNSENDRHYLEKLICKYFPSIDTQLSLENLKMELKLQVKKLNDKKSNEQITKAIQNRMLNFKDNIKHHLDTILERTQIIDTSFVRIQNNIICDAKIVKTTFFEYYKNLFCRQEIPNISLEEPWNEEINLTYEITEREVIDNLKLSADNKAPGISGLISEMMKKAGTKFVTWITNHFNLWIKNCRIPNFLLYSQIWLIPKGIYNGEIQNTRPINLIESIRKLLSTIFANRINNMISSRNLLKGKNFGFIPGKSTSDAIKILQIITEDAKIHHKPLSILYLDIRKAYDSVHPLSVMNAVRKLGFNKQYWHLLKFTFDNRKMRIMTKVGNTKYFQPTTGLEQGDPSSPILWNLFYEPLLEKLNTMKGYQIGNENISHIAYADDLTLIAENDSDMKGLMRTVEEYLNLHNMSIQTKKTFLVSNYNSEIATFTIDSSEQVLKIDKKEPVKYLGVWHTLNESTKINELIEQEIKEIATRTFKKRISIPIANYIVNAILLSIFRYRMIGRPGTVSLYQKINSICSSVVKKAAKLPRTYPSALLQTKLLPVQIKECKNTHEEQELSNFMYWVNSHSITGVLLKYQINKLQKCHPILNGEFYNCGSKYLNWIWKTLKNNDLECRSMHTSSEFKENRYVCQFYAEKNHDEQAKTLKKYNLSKMERILTKGRHNELNFKSFESFAKRKDIVHGLEIPRIIQEILNKKMEIIEEYSNLDKRNEIENISYLYQKISSDLPEIAEKDQDFNTVYTDGSFDLKSMKGGAAAIIMRNNSKEIIKWNATICNCQSSTNAEIIGLIFGLIMAEKYCKIDKIKTDSMIAVNGCYRSANDKKRMKEKNRFWLEELRSLLQRNEKIKVSWIKGHSSIDGNELADRYAKDTNCVNGTIQEYISIEQSNNYYIWNQNTKVDEDIRTFLIKKHLKQSEYGFIEKSARIKNLLVDCSNEQIRLWKRVLIAQNNYLTSNYYREGFYIFLMKSIGNILPTNENLKLWKLIENENCSNCKVKETAAHILNGECRKDFLEYKIHYIAKIWNKKAQLSTCLENILADLIYRLWSLQSAFGILNVNAIQILIDNEIPDQEILNLGKWLLKIGYEMWKKRNSEKVRGYSNNNQDIPRT